MGQYEYDELNQLTQEIRGGKKYRYTYDGGGNLLKKESYSGINDTTPSETRTYTYGDSGWKDLLTAYDGHAITYDGIGNPLSYYNGSGYTFTWDKGRQLSSLQKGSTGVNYSYNADGLRTGKTVNGVKTEYAWDGSRLMAQRTGGNVTQFLYDANGLFGMVYLGGTYYYQYNGQGDVIGLVDYQGNQVVTYTYDAWGNPVSIGGTQAASAGAANPFRYRGYYYDGESGLYYLQSRYYDPVVGRFINQDSILGGNGEYNLYVYCGSNPINRVDPSGLYWIGDVTGKRYDYIGCVTRAEIERYEGGMQNITYYSDQESSVSTVPRIGPLGSIYYKINGWDIRIDQANTNSNTQRHIHFTHGTTKYSQNIDGSPHDGTKGSPPKKLLKQVKEKGIWDWEANRASWEKSKKIIGTPGKNLPSINTDPFLKLVYGNGSPNLSVLPQVNFSPVFAPVPVAPAIPLPVPVF